MNKIAIASLFLTSALYANVHGNVEAFNKNQYTIDTNEFSAKETGINAEVEVLGFKLGTHLVAQDNFTKYTSSNVYIQYTTPEYKGLKGEFRGKASLGAQLELGTKLIYEPTSDLEISFASTFNPGINGKTLEYKNVLKDEDVKIEKNSDTKLFAHSYVLEAKYAKDNLKVTGDLLLQHVNERYEEKKQDQIEDLDKNIDKLKKQRDLLTANKDLRKKANISKEEFEKVKVTEEQLKQANQDYDKKLNDLNQKINDKKEETKKISDLEKEISPLENELNEKIRIKQEEEDNAKKSLDNLNNELTDLKEKQAQALSELNQAKQESQTKIEILNKLKEDIEAKKVKKAELEAIVKDSEQKLKLKKESINAEEENKRIILNSLKENKIQEKLNISEGIDSKISNLEATKTAYELELKALEKEQPTQQDKIQKIQSEIDKLSETIGIYKKTKDEYSKDTDIVKSKELKKNLQELETRVNNAREAVKVIEGILKDYKNKILHIDEIQKQITELEPQVKEKVDDLSKKYKKYDEAMTKVTKKSQERNQKEAEYNAKKLERENVEKTYEKKEELEGKRTELKTSKDNLQKFENEETTLRNEMDKAFRKKTELERKMADKNTKKATYNQDMQNLTDNETELKKEVFTGKINAKDVEKKLNKVNAEIDEREKNKDHDIEILEKNPYKMEANKVYIGAKLGVEYTYKNLGVESKLTLGTEYNSLKKDKKEIERNFIQYAKLNGKVNYTFEVKKNIFIVPELNGEVSLEKVAEKDLDVKYSLTPKVAFKCIPVKNLLIGADVKLSNNFEKVEYKGSALGTNISIKYMW